MKRLVVRCLCAVLPMAGMALHVHAAPTMDMQAIEQQQAVLQQEREAIAQHYDSEARQCWQRFMVNDCLQAARLQRRLALRPLDQQEQTLRAAKRALAVAERQQRLDAKQTGAQATDDVPR